MAHTKRILTIALVVALLMAAGGCVKTYYSDTEFSGIRLAEEKEDDRYASDYGKVKYSYYEKYDEKTGGWYEAEQKADGFWDYTQKGRSYLDINRRNQDRDRGNGSEGGGHP